MPEPVVRADSRSGKLVRLSLPDWRGGEYAMQAIHMTDTPPGPAGRWLIKRLSTLSDGVEPPPGSVQKLVGFGGHRYDRSGDVDLGVVNALGIAID